MSLQSGPGVDAGGGTGNADAAGDALMAPQPHWPAVLLVDGLVTGDAVDTTAAASPLPLDDVRVCIFDSSGQAITPYAVPDDAPMPLANYPGVRRGGGVDLGSYPTALGPITLDVFPATELAGDATWVTDRSAYPCKTIACDTSSLPCLRHAKVTATLADDVNVIGLVDGTGDVQAVSTSFFDTGYAGTPGSLHGAVVSFAGWHSGETVTASFADLGDGGTTATPLADPLVPDQVTSPLLVTSSIASYETVGLAFDATTTNAHFAQSLDSIAFVTDPTLDPPTFYGVRENFVFALVGDPNDETSVQNDGGRDPSFDGRGLHVVAVSYAAPEPQ